MNRAEMNEEMMTQVNGGVWVGPTGSTPQAILIHDDCGGEIEYSFWGDCVCKKCKASHWFLDDFKHHYEFK